MKDAVKDLFSNCQLTPGIIDATDDRHPKMYLPNQHHRLRFLQRYDMLCLKKKKTKRDVTTEKTMKELTRILQKVCVNVNTTKTVSAECIKLKSVPCAPSCARQSQRPSQSLQKSNRGVTGKCGSFPNAADQLSPSFRLHTEEREPTQTWENI